MFKSFYRIQDHEDRRLGEAVLTGKGVFFMLLVWVLQQVLAEVMAYFSDSIGAALGMEIGIMELNFAVDIAALVLMLFFFARFYWENLKRVFKEFKAVYIWAPLACYAMALVGNMVVSVLLLLIRGEVQEASNNQIVGDMLQEYPWQLIVLTVAVAPFIEESLFRAALCRSMTARGKVLGHIFGCLLSVGLFSLMHVYQFAFLGTNPDGTVFLTFNANEFLSILNYIPMAVAFVACSYLCRNFWGSVVCHMITNSIAVVIMLLSSLLA